VFLEGGGCILYIVHEANAKEEFLSILPSASYMCETTEWISIKFGVGVGIKHVLNEFNFGGFPFHITFLNVKFKSKFYQHSQKRLPSYKGNLTSDTKCHYYYVLRLLFETFFLYDEYLTKYGGWGIKQGRNVTLVICNAWGTGKYVPIGKHIIIPALETETRSSP